MKNLGDREALEPDAAATILPTAAAKVVDGHHRDRLPLEHRINRKNIEPDDERETLHQCIILVWFYFILLSVKTEYSC